MARGCSAVVGALIAVVLAPSCYQALAESTDASSSVSAQVVKTTWFDRVAWVQPQTVNVELAAATCAPYSEDCLANNGICFDGSNSRAVNYACLEFHADSACGNGTCGCCLLKEQCLFPGNTEFQVHGHNITLYNKYSVVYTSLGIAVGASGVVFIHQDRATLLNFQIYLLTFLCFFCMNTVGTIVHSFVALGNIPMTEPEKYSSLAWWSLELDNLFTCWSSVGFALCACFDYKILKWDLFGKLITTTIFLFFVYKLATYDGPSSWPIHESGVKQWPPNATKLCVPIYYVAELIWLPLIKRSCKGFLLLLLAIVCGEIAIQGLQSATLEDVLCSRFGEFFNQDNFWYLFSDLAMGFLLAFYLVSHQVASPPTVGISPPMRKTEALADSKDDILKPLLVSTS